MPAGTTPVFIDFPLPQGIKLHPLGCVFYHRGSEMRAGEAKALGKLAGDATAGPLVLAREMDAAISGRTFGALGLMGAPVKFIYEGISKVVYRSVGGALRGPLAAAASLVPVDGRALADSARGGLMLGALNGAAGDALDSDLALEMSVRHGGLVVQ